MRALISFVLALIMLASSAFGNPQTGSASARRVVANLTRGGYLDITDLPSRDIFLRENCDSEVISNGSLDEQMRHFCEVVTKSDACREVPPTDLLRCDRPRARAVQSGVDFLRGCGTGIFNSVRDMLSFLGQAAQFIWENITDLRGARERGSRALDAGLQFANSIRLYIYTEYDKAYQGASFPRALNAASAVSRQLMTFLVSKLSDMVKEGYTQFGCLNTEASTRRICQTLSDFIMPPAAFFAFLRHGTRAVAQYPGLQRGLNAIRAPDPHPEHRPRLDQASRILGHPLSRQEEDVIVRAHLVVSPTQPGVIASRPALAGNYTPAQLRQKVEILREPVRVDPTDPHSRVRGPASSEGGPPTPPPPVFTPDERRLLMENSIVGISEKELRSMPPLTSAPPAPVLSTPPVASSPRTAERVTSLTANANPTLHAVRAGRMPDDPFATFLHPIAGERVAVRIEKILEDGRVEVRLMDGTLMTLARRDVETLQNSDRAREIFAAAPPHQSLVINRHADSAYENVRAAFRSGEIPADPNVSFANPFGEVFDGRVTRVDKVSGEVRVNLPDGREMILRGEDLAQVRNTASLRGIELRAHPEPNYQNVRSALNRGVVPSDPYISFDMGDGVRQIGEILGVDRVLGTVRLRLQNGGEFVARNSQLESMRQSSTAREVIEARARAIAANPRLPASNDPAVQSVRTAFNEGRVPENPFVSVDLPGGRISARIDEVVPSQGVIIVSTGYGQRYTLAGDELKSIRQSDEARALFAPPAAQAPATAAIPIQTAPVTRAPAAVTPAPVAATVPSHPAFEQYGIAPRHAFSARNASYQVSDFFTDGQGRVFANVAVTINGQTTTRVFYRSNSSLSFRLLPARNIRIPNRGGYDKGPGEDFLAAAPELQQFLFQRLQSATGTMPTVDPVRLQGIIPVNRTLTDYENYEKGPDYLRVESPRPILNEARIEYQSELHSIPNPRQVTIRDPGARPDYRQPRATYRTRNDLYGDVDVYVYQSSDRSLHYTLMRDSSGRVWFSDVGSATSLINSHGVRANAIDGGQLLAPRWESNRQIPERFQRGVHPTNREYGDNWQYLREMPEIRRWYEEQNLPIPE